MTTDVLFWHAGVGEYCILVDIYVITLPNAANNAKEGNNLM